MNRPLLLFIVFIFCLGVGTIWLIEKETGTDLLPSQQKLITSYKVRQFYASNKIKLQYWWRDITKSGSDRIVSVRHESSDPKQPGITKWQDERGVWHFEYQKPAATDDK